MSDRRPEGGTNSRPLNDTIAESGPGIPDEALARGQDLPQMPDDAEVVVVNTTTGPRTARQLAHEVGEGLGLPPHRLADGAVAAVVRCPRCAGGWAVGFGPRPGRPARVRHSCGRGLSRRG